MPIPTELLTALDCGDAAPDQQRTAADLLRRLEIRVNEADRVASTARAERDAATQVVHDLRNKVAGDLGTVEVALLELLQAVERHEDQHADLAAAAARARAVVQDEPASAP
jgi:hypothetical protein